MHSPKHWLLLLAAAPLPAFGQACGGFTDVPPAAFYCNNVEWMRNRNVTLGCTLTEYCPNGFVLRSQMAAFMNRLGTVLTPTILRVTDAAFDGTYDPQAVGCVSSPVPPPSNPPSMPGSHPRQASFVASLWNHNASGTKLVEARFVVSTDGGTTWNPTSGDFQFKHSIAAGQDLTLALNGGPFELDTTSTYQFAVQATTNNPGVTVLGDCQMTVRIENRNGTSSPF